MTADPGYVNQQAEDEFADWFANTVLPEIDQARDIAHEAWCAGWDAAVLRAEES